ncbi:MAG: c-type cytochrome [Acidobacteriia bacterium]|nr:c-type cytochrome [Terriglobia bacterium]
MKLLPALLFCASLLPADNPAAPEQAARGATFFSQSCATCHSLEGKGTAVGPDLTRIARVPPRGILVAIRSTVTQYVFLVKPKDGVAFAGIQPEGQSFWWDLDKLPPEQRPLKPDQIESQQTNTKWKHPPSKSDYSTRQLADVVAYIKWVGYQSRETIDPDSLE